jgi:hypothetical protein
MVGHMKNVLAEYGIDSELRNQYLGAALGEIPPIECWPSLWVDDETAAAAEEIVSQALSGVEASDEEPWTCRQCGEEVEGSFSECWNCGRAQPGD